MARWKERIGTHGFKIDIGWQGNPNGDATALDALAARLESAGVAVRREIAAVADQRCATEVISFRDPAGNRVEAFHGGQIADELRSGAHRAGRQVGGPREALPVACA